MATSDSNAALLDARDVTIRFGGLTAVANFNLRIQPLACEVSRAASRAKESGRMWIELEDAKGAAVPAPVRKLLERIS